MSKKQLGLALEFKAMIYKFLEQLSTVGVPVVPCAAII
jgi:hypothetical protein